ncbi:Protein kinase-like domain superfamily [Sesbania bispinosa]|nr:Protein kinase-like domain superfamily [Sesbania bispinosa]
MIEKLGYVARKEEKKSFDQWSITKAKHLRHPLIMEMTAVYKARDLVTGKIVALKKVRFDNLEAESVKFMAREILVLRRLDNHILQQLRAVVEPGKSRRELV